MLKKKKHPITLCFLKFVEYLKKIKTKRLNIFYHGSSSNFDYNVFYHSYKKFFFELNYYINFHFYNTHDYFD